jgi:hypothetical protein
MHTVLNRWCCDCKLGSSVKPRVAWETMANTQNACSNQLETYSGEHSHDWHWHKFSMYRDVGSIIYIATTHKCGTILVLMCSAEDGQRPPDWNLSMYALLDYWHWWSLAKNPEIHLSAASQPASDPKCRKDTPMGHVYYWSVTCWDNIWGRFL